MTRTLFSFLALSIFILSVVLITPFSFAEKECAPGDTSCNSGSETGGEGSKNAPDSNIILREAFPGQSGTIDGSQGSLSLLGEYVSMIFRYVSAVGGIIAILVIMVAGFQLMTSGGSSEARGAAKELIQKTLTGVALLFLTGLILYTINPNFYVFSGGSTQINGKNTE